MQTTRGTGLAQHRRAGAMEGLNPITVTSQLVTPSEPRTLSEPVSSSVKWGAPYLPKRSCEDQPPKCKPGASSGVTHTAEVTKPAEPVVELLKPLLPDKHLMDANHQACPS